MTRIEAISNRENFDMILFIVFESIIKNKKFKQNFNKKIESLLIKILGY